MKKIMNNPANVVDEMLNGLVKTYPARLKRLPGFDVVVRQDDALTNGQVGLISGGGSGHEPSHAGFVGEGMLSGAVAGQVFSSPTPDQIFEAIKAVNQGKGVFMIIKNYSGDIMNFDMAKDLAEMENIEVRSVVVDDDVAVENSLYTQGRRGVAGTVFVHKVLGALAADGADLATLEATAQELVGNIHSIGVGLSGGTVPEVGEPGFTLAEDEIEFGIGIHGEPGYRREKLAPSKAMAVELVDKLLASFEWTAGDKIAVMVNGMGATPLMEQYIFMNDVLDYLEQEVPDVTVAYRKVGNYMTSLEMAGLSLTFFKLTNDDYLTALKRPVDTVGWDN